MRKQLMETNQFLGYVHRPYCPDNAWYDMENLCADEYPLLSVREKPYRFSDDHDFVLSKYMRIPDGSYKHVMVAICNEEDDRGEWVHSVYMYTDTNKRYKYGTYDGHAESALDFGGGIYIKVGAGGELITPDEIIKPVKYTRAGGIVGAATVTPCDINGNAYTISSYQEEPTEKTDGMIWVDTNDGTIVYKRWSVTTLQWQTIPQVYACIRDRNYSEEYADFSVGDAVYFDFDPVNDVNRPLLRTVKQIVNKTDDGGIVVVTSIMTATSLPATTIIIRKPPEMDYITECNNRIWGCKYGTLINSWARTYNEIYCCKLGDPTNWEVYSGISTDAWRASCGTEGPWTGAITYNGNPYFFKENSITRVYVSSTGAHQTIDYMYPGIVEGCKHGADIVGNVVYYKGRNGVYAYDGGQPVLISDPLGDDNRGPAELYSADGKLYVSKDGKLFVYDPKTKTWWKDETDTEQEANPAVYRNIFIAHGKTFGHVEDDCIVKGFTPDSEPVNWQAISGIQFYTTPDRKYIGRYSFRLELEEGSTFELEIEYDSSGEWIHCGSITGDRHGCYTLPVVPRRCDHLRYRIYGTGPMKLFAITREFEGGTDK